MNADEARRYVHVFTGYDGELRPTCLRVVKATERGVAPDNADMAALREVRDNSKDSDSRIVAGTVLDFAEGDARCQYCGRDRRDRPVHSEVTKITNPESKIS